ncbi:MAG: hypothetical protein L0Y44_16520 [Phycisphaerales bacterium]|nr:hypothetical protein [Phycisphaerales bacterium]MCI0632249.1 hypothetical protein [Phycisphaerales bacterium]MCI0675318.1 hypothetical protein [Phycisphaerales bacterium]
MFNELAQFVNGLPWGGFFPICFVVIIGFVLWSGGQRVLRVGIPLLGMLVGWSLGWMLEVQILEGFSQLICAVVCGGILLTVGILAYRAAVAVTMMVVIGLAAPLSIVAIAASAAEESGRTLESAKVDPPTGADYDRYLKSGDRQASPVTEDVERAKDALALALSEQEERQFEEAWLTFNNVRGYATQQWEKTPHSLRPTLILAAVIGSLVGLVLGIVTPAVSATAMTSMAGSLLWLGGMRVLALRFEVPDGPWLPTSNVTWLIVWLITSIVGGIVQWIFRGSGSLPADKQEPKPQPLYSPISGNLPRFN